jgi:hypothetical protein
VVYEPRSVVLHNIAPARLSWPWMWRRAYTAGLERRVTGVEERLPQPRRTRTDLAFRVAICIPFLLGKHVGQAVRRTQGSLTGAG